jgi:hypothetical protein
VILLLTPCEKKETTPSPIIPFEGAQKVTVNGYSDHLMEPFYLKGWKNINVQQLK